MRISDWSSDVCSSDLDDSFRPGSAGPALRTPIKAFACHHAFGHQADGIASILAKIGLGVPHAVTEQGVRPTQRPLQLARIRVDQQLLRIEAMPSFRIVRAVRTISVQQARFRLEEHTSELQSLMRISYA